MALSSKRINGVILQKAIIFARIKEKQSVSMIDNITKKIENMGNILTGEDQVTSNMKANGYQPIKVQYNPESINITTHAKISDKDDAAGITGDSGGTVELNDESVLSFKLIFEAVDTLGKNTVKEDAEGIIALMVSDITRNVTFYYGDILFSGELDSVQVQYTMFDINGNPIWAEVSVVIREEEEKEEDEDEAVEEKKPSTSFEKLSKEYGDFSNPVSIIKINGKDISENKKGIVVSDLEVELSSGYEASTAHFSLYNTFDKAKKEFIIDEIKKFIMLGSSVAINTGYGEIAKNIFRGYISRVNFSYEEGEMPHIEITCMDVKVIMMAGNHAKQLQASSYGEAVESIFDGSIYQKLLSNEIITELNVGATPDKKVKMPAAPTDEKEKETTIEMVNESDYEFVVRAAKKFNYEFFIDSGKVIFRKSKAVTGKLMDLKLGHGVLKFNVEYDMTGLVESIHVRGMDPKRVKLIKAKKKWNNKISIGNKAKQLIKKSERIYIDPTVANQQEADYRAGYLMEDMSYRFGTLTCTSKGMPELKPGNLIGLDGLGNPVNNEFYVTEVKHLFSSNNEYTCEVTAKAAKIGDR